MDMCGTVENTVLHVHVILQYEVFLRQCRGRTRCNVFKLKEDRYYEETTHYEGQALEQAAQRTCGCLPPGTG